MAEWRRLTAKGQHVPMAATAIRPDLSKGARVRNTVGLRDVPEGTAGTVMLKNGFEWIRYWVRFENGVQLGTIPREKLDTPSEWKRRLEGGDDVELIEESGSAGDAGAAAADDGGSAGKATPSGTMVPQKLLDRSSAARTRLAG
jgi:hypothetical protein